MHLQSALRKLFLDPGFRDFTVHLFQAIDGDLPESLSDLKDLFNESFSTKLSWTQGLISYLEAATLKLRDEAQKGVKRAKSGEFIAPRCLTRLKGVLQALLYFLGSSKIQSSEVDLRHALVV